MLWIGGICVFPSWHGIAAPAGAVCWQWLGAHQVKPLVLGTQVTTQVRVMPTSCCPLCQVAEVLMTKPTLDPEIQAFSIPDEVHRHFTESDKITSWIIL